MTSPWNTEQNPMALSRDDGLVTLVDGRTFSLSRRGGDCVSDPEGLFVLDTRVLARWSLTLDGMAPEPLAVSTSEPYAGQFVGRGAPAEGHADSTVVVRRSRNVRHGMSESITVHNYGPTATTVAVAIAGSTDFAGLFDVKENRARRLAAEHPVDVTIDDSSWVFEQTSDRRRRVEISFATEPDRVAGVESDDPSANFDSVDQGGRGEWKPTISPGGSWTLKIDLVVWVDGHRLGDTAQESSELAARRMEQWRSAMPQVRSSIYGIGASVEQGGEDLGALRIIDSAHPERPVIAAGAPWFMTLFGRDSLLTSWMSLPAGPELSLGVLETLAEMQGREVNARTEEEPGRILHEIRFGNSTSDALQLGESYFGTVDATPLWVMLLAEVVRWGVPVADIAHLLPHADRAIAWLDDFGDRDGDGFIEYHRANPEGLANQGWKDSWDGINFADGRQPIGPIALCEAQAYAYGARIGRAELAEATGDTETATTQRAAAAALKAAFNEQFWSDEHQTFGVALDGEKTLIDATTSNLGHCLWSGIVDADKAPILGRSLVGPTMFTGYGIRTLASDMGAFNPVSYHNGSVWPHDTTIGIAGLARYGLREEASKVITGLLGVAQDNGGRLPELFAGFDRSTVDVPAVYPASCVPQAWAAAAPLLMLRVILGLDPDVANGTVSFDPHLPGDASAEMEVTGLWVAGERLDVHVDSGGISVSPLTGAQVITPG